MLQVWIDNSGSTHHNFNYWSKVSDVVEEVHRTEKHNATYHLWNSTCRSVNYVDIVRRHLSSSGSTDIQLIAQHTKNHSKDDSLLIITDGKVCLSDVKRCKKIIEDDHETRVWKKVIVYILDDDDYINFSVCAPFLKGNPFEVHGYKKTVISKLSAAAPNPLLSRGYGTNPQLFLDQFEALKTEIFVENMGSDDTHEVRDSILQLQKEMIATLTDSSKEESDTRARRMDAFMQEWRTIMYEHESSFEQAVALFQKNIPALFPYADTEDNNSLSLAEQVSIRIKELVAMCDTSLQGFAMEPHSKLERARLVDDEDIDDLPDKTLGEWECPITCEENEVMCILVPTKSRNLLKHLSKKQLKKLAAWPELLDVVIPMEAKQPIGLAACKQLLTNNPNAVSPFTREPVDRAFVFYTGNDVGIARKVHALNDFVLLSCLFDGKIVGQTDILFCAMFLKNAVHICNEVGFKFREYLQKRLKMRKTNITLSGLPIPPLVRVPIDLALWYCFATEEILDENGPYVATNVNRYREAFRQDRKIGQVRLQTISGILCMDDRTPMMKKLRFDYAAEMTESLRVRKTQTHAPISRTLCYILSSVNIYDSDGDVFYENRQTHWMAQTLFMVGGIMPILDRGKRVTELDLKNIYPPFRIAYYERPPFHKTHTPVSPVPICTESCRPYYDADKMKSLRSKGVCSDTRYKPEVFSMHRFFAEWLISDIESYYEIATTTKELSLVYANQEKNTSTENIFTSGLWKKECVLGRRLTSIMKKFAKFAHAKQWKKGIPVLPHDFRFMANEAMGDYKNCIWSLTHSEFKERYNNTYDLEKRKLAEQRDPKPDITETIESAFNPFAHLDD
jgi:hypothetical protein